MNEPLNDIIASIEELHLGTYGEDFLLTWEKSDADVRGVNETLDSFATVKLFAVLPIEFSIDKGEMTPSLKLRRKVISSRYRELLESMYAKGR